MGENEPVTALGWSEPGSALELSVRDQGVGFMVSGFSYFLVKKTLWCD